MSYQLSADEINVILKELSKTFRIFAPVKIEKKGRFSDTDQVRWGEVSSFEQFELNHKGDFSPKEIIFPITQTVFYFTEDEYRVPEQDTRGIIIFLRPCDINGIDRLDTIFLRNGKVEDPYYKQYRERVKYFMIECTTGFENCFCVSMGSNRTDQYAAAFRFGESIQVEVKDETILPYFNKCSETAFTPEFITENEKKVRVPDVETMPLELFESPMWDEYHRRCIACGRCNTSCITCSCFTSRDIFYDDNPDTGERRRTWAGCHVDKFTDMAGGHSFRKKYGQRMRFKSFHKVYDFRKRFGKNMCVGCGRCDDMCPEYISFSHAINKLSDELAKGGNHGK